MMPNKKKYRPDRGGHAPGHIREQFREWMEDDTLLSHADALELTGKLWNCTDTMPSDLCQLLELTQGSSYAQGVRHWREMYNLELNRPVKRWGKLGVTEDAPKESPATRP